MTFFILQILDTSITFESVDTKPMSLVPDKLSKLFFIRFILLLLLWIA